MQRWQDSWKEGVVPTWKVNELFACGHHKGREIFVARIDGPASSLYMLCAFTR